MSEMVIRNLHANIDGKEILKGVDLTVKPGEVHALMGPNGTGKSTLAYVLMGHPNYEVTEGEVIFNGENILELEPDERAHKGVFLAFQYPIAIPGVTVANFLRTAINSHRKVENEEDKGLPIPEFRRLLKSKMDLLKMDHSFAGRYLNEGFSGGEKKRAEILQLATLEPKIAILDETDSGLDIDALRIVSEGVNALRGPGLGVLVITHYQRILNYIKPDFVHIMMDGRVVESGGPELALHLEEHGYDWLREKGDAVIS
jgi:Fe-S cluster assembly ATP-binding protein